MWATKRVGATRRQVLLFVAGVFACSVGLMFVAGPAVASDGGPKTASNVTVSESVVETDAPDPASDRLGWEGGVWANATLSIDQSDGINQTELEAVVARTMARVESVRGIEFDRTPPVRILFADEQQAETGERTYSDTQRTLLNAEYEALFLINESRDAVESQRTLFGSGVNGYYSPGTGDITMISPNSSVRQIREDVLAQELFHAQQDTQFDLPAVSTIEERNARNGYVEGDANYVQQLYEQRCDGAWAGTCYRPDREGFPDLSGLNDGMQRLFRQPYQSGYAFVRDRHQQQGWEAVNRLYEQPPASAEQVIHPEKYGEDEPTALDLTDRSTGEWEPLSVGGQRVAGSVGEAGLYVSLVYPAMQTAGQSEIIPLSNHRIGGFDDQVRLNYAHPTTAGWDGDRLVPYTATASNATGYVYETTWDTASDARAFHEAYRKLLAYHGAEPVEGLANTYRIPERDGFTDAFYVNRTADRLRIVNAPSVDGLSAVRQGAAPPSNATQPASPWERTNVVWDRNIDADSLSTLTVSDGTLYVQDPFNSTLYGIDGATGELAWTQQVDRSIVSSSVSTGSVFLGTAAQELTAVDGSTGDVRWTQDTDGVVVSTPTVTDGTVYAGTADGYLYALDVATGEQVWTMQLDGARNIRLNSDDETIVVGSTTGLTALDAATGEQEWNVEFSDTIFPRPTVSDGTVYAVTSNTSTDTGRLHAIDTDTGEIRWSAQRDGLPSPTLTVDDGTVYATSIDIDSQTGTLFALDDRNGDQQWRFEVNGSINVAPVVANGTVYTGSTEGQLSAIEAASGEHRWSTSTGGAVTSPLVVTAETLYVGSQSGLLSALDAKTGDQRWTLFADRLARVSPAVDNGTVYTIAGSTVSAVQGSPTDDDSREDTGGDDGGEQSGTTPDDTDDSTAPDETPQDTPTGNDTYNGTESPDQTPDSDENGPGMGVLVALIGVVGVAVVARYLRA